MDNGNLNQGLDDVGKLIVTKLKVLAKEDGFYSSGELDNSFRYEALANNLAIYSAKYARALSDGVTKDPNYNKSSDKFRSDIIKWAKSKGIAPRRSKKGRFTSYMSMANAMAISIRRNGISQRFGYKGSGFFQVMEDQLKEQIRTILSDSYEQDLKLQIKKSI